MKNLLIITAIFCFLIATVFGKEACRKIWIIGKADQSPNEFALASNRFKSFVGNDFS